MIYDLNVGSFSTSSPSTPLRKSAATSSVFAEQFQGWNFAPNTFHSSLLLRLFTSFQVTWNGARVQIVFLEWWWWAVRTQLVHHQQLSLAITFMYCCCLLQSYRAGIDLRFWMEHFLLHSDMEAGKSRGCILSGSAKNLEVPKLPQIHEGIGKTEIVIMKTLSSTKKRRIFKCHNGGREERNYLILIFSLKQTVEGQ